MIFFFHTCLDFDTVQFGGKLVVNCKHMAIFDLLGLWLLGENSLCWLPTGQRLQCSHQLPLWDVRLLLDFLHSEEVRLGVNTAQMPQTENTFSCLSTTHKVIWGPKYPTMLGTKN